MAGRPQLSNRTGPTYALSNFMNDNWDKLVGRTNEDVASDLGYRSANIISMFRTGKTRIPLEKLPDIARLMKLDLTALLPLWFEQYWGERADAKTLIKGFAQRLLSSNELPLVENVRKATKNKDMGFTKDVIDAATLVLTDEDVRKAAEAAAKKKGLVSAS